MEHENKRFKTNLKSYRGDYTQSQVDRISKGYSRIRQIVANLDKEINYHTTSGKNPASKDTKDVLLLVDLYNRESTNLIACTTESRYHSVTTMNICKNLMAGLNGINLYKWIQERIQLGRIRHHYRQFVDGS